jgi:MoxR-like ATPase
MALRLPQDYRASPDLAAAVNVALTLGMPLLLTGEPGSGKSGLADSLAWELATHDEQDPKPLRFVVKSDTQARDLFYRFDTVGRFHASQTPDAISDPRQFINFEALGKAILHAKSPDYAYKALGLPLNAVNHPGKPKRSVVLIDEIDKAPRDVPNDILVELERLEFEIPELRTVGKLADENSRGHAQDKIGLEPHENRYRPIVIITSNSEKALPDPFLRRCVYHHLEFPPFRQAEGEQREEIVTVEDIVASRLGSRYANGGQLLVEQGISLFRHLREESGRLERRPTLAELLDWLNYLLPGAGEGRPAKSLIALGEERLSNSLKNLLLKRPADQARTAELWLEWRKKQQKPQ